jgi:hypothetical protein
MFWPVELRRLKTLVMKVRLTCRTAVAQLPRVIAVVAGEGEPGVGGVELVGADPAERQDVGGGQGVKSQVRRRPLV